MPTKRANYDVAASLLVLSIAIMQPCERLVNTERAFRWGFTTGKYYRSPPSASTVKFNMSFFFIEICFTTGA